MNSDVNRSSNYLSTPYYINHPRNLQDKLDHTVAIHEELVDALMQHGCSNCIAILRDIVRKHNRISRGDGSLDIQTSMGGNPNGIFDTKK